MTTHSLRGVRLAATTLVGALLLVTTAMLGACGPAAPPSKTASEQQQSEPAGEGAGQAAAPSAGQCAEQCAELIEQAGDLLAQASALEGAKKAQLALYVRAGTAHLRAWRGCDLRRPGGEDLACPGSDEVVPGMVQAFQGAQLPEQVVFAYLVALDERFRDDGAEVTGEAPDGLREAAAAALEAAESDPGGEHAADTVAAAAYAELALHEVDEASRIARRLARNYARKAPDTVSLVAASIASYYNDREQHAEALSVLTRATNPARAKHPRVGILWHAERGRALAGAGRPGAAREFAAVLRSWKTPSSEDPSPMVGRQEPAPMLGRERVVDAVGAAHFFRGEAKRARADEMAPPRYRGPQTADGVERFIQGPLARWAQKRQRAAMAAAAEYDEVLAIRPVPPPRWVVAASAQTGRMWHDLAEAMTSIELPTKLADDQPAFDEAMAGSARPARDNARRAFERCRQHAEAASIDDDYADACREALHAE